MKTVDLEQGSEAWHAWRKTGLGGSDAPAVYGNCPYRTPLMVFREKLDMPVLLDEPNKEFIFERGHEIEQRIRADFAKKTGVEMKPLCVEHSQHKIMLASLDGFDSGLGILEGKFVGKDVMARAREGEIPEHHMIQIQHQLEVADVDLAQWYGHDGKTGIIVPVERDRNIGHRLVELEHGFWGLVRTKTAPALSPRDYLIPEEQTLLLELREAKEHAENAEEHFKLLKQKAVDTYSHAKVAGAGIKLFKVERSGSLDIKSIPEVAELLKTLAPEYLESFRKEGSTSWTVTIDRIKKK